MTTTQTGCPRTLLRPRGTHSRTMGSGLEATGIDWAGNKHQPTVTILQVDLTTTEGQNFIWALLKQDHVLYVHMGPPCGTFTRARERPIPEWQRRWDAPCPGPLRSDDRPDGLSPRHLMPLDSLKVHKGNVIAEFCAKVASFCIEHNKFFSIENPTGSLLWKLPCYIELLSRPGVASVDFHACMWGSRRNKRTSFVTNMPQLEVLRKECPNDGSHEHAPPRRRTHRRRDGSRSPNMALRRLRSEQPWDGSRAATLDPMPSRNDSLRCSSQCPRGSSPRTYAAARAPCGRRSRPDQSSSRPERVSSE